MATTAPCISIYRCLTFCLVQSERTIVKHSPWLNGIAQQINAVALIGFAAYLIYYGAVNILPETLNEVTARAVTCLSSYMAELVPHVPLFARDTATATVSRRRHLPTV
jgi:hypothetical protein